MRMKKPNRLTSMGIGFGLMYLLDPRMGKVRRARIRNRFILAKNMAVGVKQAACDLWTRLAGLCPLASTCVEPEPVPEPVVEPPAEVAIEEPPHGWSPATRLVTGVLGAAMFVRFLRRPTLRSTICGGIGLGLCLRAATNKSPEELFSEPNCVNTESTPTSPVRL